MNADPFGFTDDIFIAKLKVSSPTGTVTTDVDEFDLYPNPANNTLILDVRDKQITGIALSNLLGERLTWESFRTNSKGIRMDVSSLPCGTYFVEVLCKDKRSIKKWQKM